MDAATSFLAGQSKQDILLGCLIFQAICVFPLIICAFVVSNSANMGFNGVLTSFLDLAYVLGTFYVVRNSKAPIAYGFVIGSGSMLFMQNLMASIYWGQMAGCKNVEVNFHDLHLSEYSCGNTTAYGAVSAFSALLFVSQLALVVCVVLWRGELIVEVSGGAAGGPSAAVGGMGAKYTGISTSEHSDPGVINFATSNRSSYPPQHTADF